MKNKRIMSVVAIVLVICMILVYVVSLLPMGIWAAPTKAQYQSELKDVQGEKSQIAQQARDKEVQISELQGEIDVLQNDINVYAGKIAQTEIELAAAQQEEQNQYAAAKLRLRTMYEDNNTTYINLLMSGEGLTEFLSDLEIVKQMVSYDNGMHTRLQEIRVEVEDKKTTLETEKGVLDGQKAELVAKQNTLVTEKAGLDSMAKQLSAEENKILAEIRQIEENERKVQQAVLASGSHSATSIYKGGTFAYPCATTTISSSYGYRIHPIYGTRKLHAGIDFPVSTGASVMAAGDGTVILATNYDYGGYGNTVIIDHGGGITTLYAHNSSVVVSVGQKVTRGQLVARAGSTGNSTGPHCHFEVRVNGKTTDPMNYLR